MRRSLIQHVVLAVVVVVVIGTGILGLTLMASARSDQRVPIKGQSVPLLKYAHTIGAASAQQQVDLSIGLQMRNQPELAGLLTALYDPRSPQYHHFLTPQQFMAEFGPTADQQQQVVDYLRGAGITVNKVAPNGLLINAHATVAQAEAAFQVQINNYKLGSRQFYANANPPAIPSSVAPLILSVGGLDNSVQLRPLTRHARLHQLAHHAQQPLAGYKQADLLGAYDMTPLHQAGIQGNNQTVAVFELDGYQQSDISQFLSQNNLGQPSITNVLVDGVNGSAGAGAIEVELDIDVVAEIAPKAAQIVYEGPNTTQGVNDTYNQIVTDNKAQITTISWGECETQSGATELQTLDGIFKQGAAQGIALFAASGDSGAYDCNDTNLAVDSPAGDPYITGVGGTNLQETNGTYASESAWGDPTSTQRSANGAGSGGGLSNTFNQPSWQVAPGVSNQYSNGKREVPDVSADADPKTGYAVYCTVSASGCPATGNIVVGGTSAAAPLWAASTALINEYLQSQGKSRIGFANPTLYKLANEKQANPPFHDVTAGDNLYYPATAGYDLATGLGSPDVYNIARDLAGSSTPAPVPTPVPTSVPVPAPTPAPTSIVGGDPTPAPVDNPTPIPVGDGTPVSY
ncbi:MAG: S53 family serine peptidase [Ktedonobacteraceae bacterium]